MAPLSWFRSPRAECRTISPSDTVRELEIARAETLGLLLGVVDGVILSLDNPKVFDMVEAIDRLRDARSKYNRATEALIDARLAQ